MKLFKILFTLILCAGIAHASTNWEKIKGTVNSKLGIYGMYIEEGSCGLARDESYCTVKTCYGNGYYEISRIAITEREGVINRRSNVIPIMIITDRKLYGHNGFIKKLNNDTVKLDMNKLEESRYDMLNALSYWIVDYSGYEP